MPPTEKSREIRLRRAAKRRGYRLVKRRRFDPAAYDYGLYVVVPDNNRADKAADDAFTRREGLTLDQAEEKINSL